MARLTLVTRENEKTLKQGDRHKVFVRVCHNKETRYIDSGITVGVSSYRGKWSVNFYRGMVTDKEPGYLVKMQDLDKIYHDLEQRLAAVVNPGMMTCPELVAVLKGETLTKPQATVGSAGDAYVRALRNDQRKGYADMVEVSVSDWIKMMGDVRCDRVTPAMVETWRRRLRQKQHNGHPIAEASVNKKLAHLKAILNSVRKDGVQWSVQPFEGVKMTRTGGKDCALNIRELMTWKAVGSFSRPMVEWAYDIWWLSFWLGGMNYKDMLQAEWKDDSVTFVRQKTVGKVKKAFTLPMVDSAKAIAEKYVTDGRMVSPYKYGDGVEYLTKNIQELCTDMPRRVIFYAARHTFDQCCLECNVPIPVSEYMMAHNDNGRAMKANYGKATTTICRVWMTRLEQWLQSEQTYMDRVENCMI